MTKKQKLQKFMSDHREALEFAATALAGVAAVAGVVVYASKTIGSANEAIDDYNEWADQQNQWLQEQFANGKDVFLLIDNAYLVIPTETERQYIPFA